MGYFSDNQELRTTIYFYLHRSTTPMFNEGIIKKIESPVDILNNNKSMNALAFKLLDSLRQTLESPNDKPSVIKNFIFKIYRVTEEFAWMIQRDEIRLSQMLYDQKQLSDEINKMKSYTEEVEKIKNEVGDRLQDVKEEIRTQKIDALTMTTLVFTAFTFLTVNAGVISGISQITVIDIPEMIKIFLIANFTVLFGIIVIVLLLRMVFQRK